MYQRNGFTLVELMVVTAIIAVLLALLTPALDKAIYQAELAVCGANLGGIAEAAVQYASGSRRRYAPFPVIGERDPASQISGRVGHGTSTPAAARGPWDRRPVLARFLPINKTLVDPLCKKVNLETTAAEPWTYSSYLLWFGFGYKVAGMPAQPGMLKLGDRMGWGGDRFGILASDSDLIAPDIVFASASHPDDAGVLPPLVWQNQSVATLPADVPVTAEDNENFTLSRWQNNVGQTYKRGLLDTNYAFDDGSVRRYNRVKWDEAGLIKGERMVKVPPYSDGSSYTNGQAEWFHLPRQ